MGDVSKTNNKLNNKKKRILKLNTCDGTYLRIFNKFPLHKLKNPCFCMRSDMVKVKVFFFLGMFGSSSPYFSVNPLRVCRYLFSFNIVQPVNRFSICNSENFSIVKKKLFAEFQQSLLKISLYSFVCTVHKYS